MQYQDVKIIKNEKIAKGVYMMKLEAKHEDIIPGQFINIEAPSYFLKRPISIYDVDDEGLTIVYKVVGKGTDVLSNLEVGTTLKALYPLGNGYDVKTINPDVLVGGGVGIPPLYYLLKSLQKENKDPWVVLGYRSKEEAFLYEEFKKLTDKVLITSDDGSIGFKGNVTEGIKANNLKMDEYCSCGPLVMMKSLYHNFKTKAHFSLEERMGCGFGACMGCSIKTKNGFKRVCKEGPVFEGEELKWED